MGVYEGRGQLAKAFKLLMLQWNEAKMSWNDIRAKSFEEKYLDTLEADLRQAGNTMDQMAVLLGQIRRECE
jgi:hypothetical protein